MGVVTRPDSPFFWLNLERPGQRVIRESTKVPVAAPTPKQLKENRLLAEALYAARMGDLARARHQIQTERPIITFRSHRDWYLTDVSVHKRNLERETSMLKQLGAFFDTYGLHELDLALCMRWRTERARKVAPATVNREIDILRHLMGSAVPKYLDANPVTGLKHLRVPEREPRILEPDQETKLLAALDKEDSALILCALDTLQRLSSVADLKWAQDHGEYLTFLNTKTKGGKVPVSTRLRKALDALPKDDKHVFPKYQGVEVGARRNAVIRMFKAACTTAGIDSVQKTGGLTFHCLRHTGASRMLERGANIDTVRRIGGWANLDVLMRYLHPTDDASKRAVETIGTRPIHAKPKARKNRRKTRR